MILLLLPFFFIYIFPFFFIEANYQPYDSTLGFVSLILGVFLWFSYSFIIFYSGVIGPWRDVRKSINYVRNGRRLRATIVDSALISIKDGMEVRNVVFQFNNYNQQELLLKYQLTDTKPEQERFIEGKETDIILNTEKRGPVIYPADAEYSTNKPYFRSIFLFIVFNLVYVVGTFIFYEHLHGTGPDFDIYFLNPAHPWLMGAYIGFIMVVILTLITRIGNSKSSNHLVANGYIAQADVVQVKETGTTVNEQPQISFILNYKNRKGQTQVAEFKKYVSRLNMSKVGIGKKEILYLEENPEDIIFTSDLLDI